MLSSSLFFFNDTATTEIYTLSLHDALPIFWLEEPGAFSRKLLQSARRRRRRVPHHSVGHQGIRCAWAAHGGEGRSEEHTSELQSRLHLVCRLLLEKKKPREHRRVHAQARGR